MDIRLPDISGYEAIEQILKVKPQMKIIAQTAYATAMDKQNALDSGCLDYISKPVKRELLLTLLSKYI
jgi:CheY-like chemotaxis protein